MMGMRFVIGCEPVMEPANLPTIFATLSETSTPALPYIHYTPSKEINVHLEFDYPSYWYFNEDKYPYTDGYSIFLSDPLMLTAPSREPNQPHGNPSSYGSVYIWIEPLETGQTLSDIVARYRDGVQKALHHIVLIRNYPIKIDGLGAHAFETLNDTPEMYTSTMFERTIFFVVDGAICRIDFAISVNERGGEFEKGYEYFLNSLKIGP